MLQSPSSPHITPPSVDFRGWYFKESITGVEFRALSLEPLIRQIESHRFSVAKNISVDLAYDWKLRLLDDLCKQNPLAPCGDNRTAPGFEPPHAILGRALWKELHLKSEEPVAPGLAEWFWAWIERVPDYGGCACRTNAKILLAEMAPRFDSGFKQWCSEFHDEISRRIGKPAWAPNT